MALAIMLWAASSNSFAKERHAAARGAMTSQCTRRITPADVHNLDSLLKNLPDEAVLCLGAGVYHFNFWIERSITIRGTGRQDVIIDGGGTNPTVQIVKDTAAVTIESLTLRHGAGSAESGSNLQIFDSRIVVVHDVAILDGTSGPGGVLVGGGMAQFEKCLISGNEGTLAQAVFVFQDAEARFTDCVIAGNKGVGPTVTASWAGHIILKNSTIVGKATPALRAVGTGSQAPSIEAADCIISSEVPVEIKRGGAPEPKVLLKHNAISVAPTTNGVSALDNIVGPFSLDAQFRPAPGSPIANYGARE